MIPASYIKKDIDFNKSFRSILEVLKLVAVSQYHALEKKLKTFEKFGEVLAQFFDSIDLRFVQHPFLNPGGDAPMAVIAVTSDAGLLGGMNMQVVTKAYELAAPEGGRLIVVGERGQVYAQEMKIPFVYFPGVVDAERFSQAMQLRDYLVQEILSGKIGVLKVVYCQAVSLVIHRVEAETLVPFVKPAPPSDEAPRRKETPAKSKEFLKDHIFESSPGKILEYLVYLFLGERLYEIFGMSRLAEQAARFVHLEESSQKILDLNKKLLLQYFRRRHEIIDQNMRELFASRAIYAK